MCITGKGGIFEGICFEQSNQIHDQSSDYLDFFHTFLLDGAHLDQELGANTENAACFLGRKSSMAKLFNRIR
ncbi:hypothetical protein SDC9_171416 [bioreactor metagenome]|uniref:Uncharacterized protein n=1 Tax=bioreactor metagenome TaxID=1076179 RepID=A0A645GJY0_9ZZZZ